MTSQNNHPEKPILEIERSTLLTLFQITNPSFFSQSNNVALDSGAIGVVRKILATIKSPVAAHFQENAATRDITLYFAHEPQGSFFIFMDYTLKGAIGGPNRSVMVIGRTFFDPEDTTTENRDTPHFVMTGYNVAGSKKQGQLFIPQEILCRASLEDDTNDSMLGVCNQDAFKAAICYADQAFRTIAIGRALDMRDNQYWLSEEAWENVPSRFATLMERTLNQLHGELILTEKDFLDGDLLTQKATPTTFYIAGPHPLQ